MQDTNRLATAGVTGQHVIHARAAGPYNVGRDLVREALIARDPLYVGDEAAFCEAYRNGNYAPDLITLP